MANPTVTDDAMGWQESLWERLTKAGDWPRHMIEIVGMLTALPFYLGAVVYGYFPFFVLGAAFTAVAWLAEEKRLGGEPRLTRRVVTVAGRALARPWWTVTALALVVVGVWREAVWIALVGIIVLRGGVRRGAKAAGPPRAE